MRYLVSGCAGFIGASICKELIELGHTVLGVDRLDSILYPSFVKKRRLTQLGGENFKFLECDIRDKAFSAQVKKFRPEIVINEAGLPGQSLSWSSLDAYTEANFLAAYTLGQISLEVGVTNFVQASTSSIYGLSAEGNEDSPIVPGSPYGVTKMSAEYVLSALFAGAAINFNIVRYFSVFGPWQRPDMGIYKFIDSALNDRPVCIFGDGSQSRDFTYVDDVVGATLAASNQPFSHAAFNISGGEIKTVNQVLNEIEIILGKSLTREYVAAPRGDQLHTSAITQKARDILSWNPKVGFSAGLAKQINWQQNL